MRNAINMMKICYRNTQKSFLHTKYHLVRLLNGNQLQCKLFNIRQNLKVYLKGIQLYPLLIQKYVISKTHFTKVESSLILPSKQMLFFIFLFQDFITDIISFYLKITIDNRILHLHYNIRGGISGLYMSMFFKMIIFLFRIDPLFERNMV